MISSKTHQQMQHMTTQMEQDADAACIARLLDPLRTYRAPQQAIDAAVASVARFHGGRVVHLVDSFYDTADRQLLRRGMFLLTRTTLRPPATQWYLFAARAHPADDEVAYDCTEGETAVVEALRRMQTPPRLPCFTQIDSTGPRAFAPHLVAHISTTCHRLSADARLHVASWGFGGRQGVYGVLSATEAEAVRLHGLADAAEAACYRAATPVFAFLNHAASDAFFLWFEWLGAQSAAASTCQAQRLVGYGPIASADANVFRDLCSFPDWQTSADADADYEFIDAGN